MHLNGLFVPKTKTIAEEAICKTFVIFAFSLGRQVQSRLL